MRVVLLMMALWGGGALAADAPGQTNASVDTQQLGRDLLFEMARFLAGLDRFGFQLRTGYDVVQDDGRKIEFLENWQITVSRPNRLRLDATRADGQANTVVFDGDSVWVFDEAQGVYAHVDQPGSVDDAVLYFVRELAMRLPLAEMLTTRFPDELARNVVFADFVEESVLLEMPTYHVVGSLPDVDFQAWIAEGDQPWPLRIVLTYRNETGQPQFRADFSNWSARPPVAKSRFRFSPPEAAEQIPFAVQVPVLAEPVQTP